MIVQFNALNTQHKQPVGALKLGAPLKVRLQILRQKGTSALHLALTKDGESEVCYKLKWMGIADGYDIYGAEIQILSTGLYFYRFIAKTADGEVHIGCDDSLCASYGSGCSWQCSVYKEYYEPSNLLKGGIVYHIFVDRFAIGNERKKSNPLNEYREDWGGVPRDKANHRGEWAVDFFGGNLAGITQKLDYLKSLNVSVIYLSPIFEARSNHKYDTGDYFKIDPDFGSLQDFKELCSAAKQRGIGIILDGVFSHTGSDSIYFNKEGRYNSLGAFQASSSPYYKWFKFRHHPLDYECWWNFKTLPNVDELNPSYNDFINGENGVVRYWLRNGASGFRLDVADELPDPFLDNLSAAAKAEKSDAFILGEVWEDASNKISYGARRRFLEGRQLDSVMNYPLRAAILDFVRGGDALSLANTVLRQVNNYPPNALNNALNLLGSHDTARLLTEVGGVMQAKTAALLQYLLPGAPCIYYGDEAGMEGKRDPYCRLCFPWGKENKELTEWYILLGKARVKLKKYLQNNDFKVEYCSGSKIIFWRLDARICVELGGECYIELKGKRIYSF